jgi:hypothetical protein
MAMSAVQSMLPKDLGAPLFVQVNKKYLEWDAFIKTAGCVCSDLFSCKIGELVVIGEHYVTSIQLSPMSVDTVCRITGWMPSGEQVDSAAALLEDDLTFINYPPVCPSELVSKDMCNDEILQLSALYFHVHGEQLDRAACRRLGVWVKEGLQQDPVIKTHVRTPAGVKKINRYDPDWYVELLPIIATFVA